MYNIISIFKKYTLTFINHIYNLEQHGGKDWTDRTQYVNKNYLWVIEFEVKLIFFFMLFSIL